MSVTRRDFLTSTASTLAIGFTSARGSAQAPAAPAPVPRFQELRGGVGLFTAQGGAIGYLINDAGVLAVDSQYSRTISLFQSGLRERSPRPVELLLNTHHHADHTGGNQALRSTAKRIVAHENCVAWHRKVAAEQKNEGQQSFADTPFTTQWRTDFGGETVQARYYGPGHTGGDAVVHFQKANVVHMGDLLFNRAHPNIDRPAGAVIANWITVLEKVDKAHGADTVFVAGHGKDNAVQCTRADLQHFRDYLTACLDTARKAVAAGQPREALLAQTDLKGFEDTAALNQRLTLGFVLGTCYDELAAKKK
jgi:glyoxylase-like metal-dependent hydrolase (beta-lactamase superfamily II)